MGRRSVIVKCLYNLKSRLQIDVPHLRLVCSRVQAKKADPSRRALLSDGIHHPANHAGMSENPADAELVEIGRLIFQRVRPIFPVAPLQDKGAGVQSVHRAHIEIFWLGFLCQQLFPCQPFVHPNPEAPLSAPGGHLPHDGDGPIRLACSEDEFSHGLPQIVQRQLERPAQPVQKPVHFLHAHSPPGWSRSRRRPA